jgi:hypothetical protein
MPDGKRDLPAGWGMPGNSRKFHFFDADSLTSLCGKWGFFAGRRDPDNGTKSKDDCAACRRKVDAK